MAGRNPTLAVELSDVRIGIADNGTGIAPEAAPHVSIVKWVAGARHGAVELASQPGAGSASP